MITGLSELNKPQIKSVIFSVIISELLGCFSRIIMPIKIAIFIDHIKALRKPHPYPMAVQSMYPVGYQRHNHRPMDVLLV